MKKTDIKSPLLLFLAAFIWGVAFVAQSKAKDYSVEPFTFNAVRNIIGGLTLLPCIFFFGQARTEREEKRGEPEDSAHWRESSAELFSVSPATSSRSESTIPPSERPVFITAMYIVLVPILGIFLKRRAGIKVWISVFLAVAGLYLLCMTRSFPWEKEMPWCFSALVLPSTFWSSIIFRRRWTG